LLLGLSCLPVHAQTQPEKQLKMVRDNIQTALNTGETTPINQQQLKLRPLLEHNDNLIRKHAHYYFAYSLYRMVTLTEEITKDQKDTYLEEAVSHLNKSLEIDDQFAEAKALMGSCYGMMIDGMWDGMRYGSTSSSYLDEALALAPQNPRVNMLYAIGKMKTPAMWGGDMEVALNHFQVAKRAYGDSTEVASPFIQWGHEEIYAWLGIWHMEQGQPDQALRYFDQGLNVNPEYDWIKEVLKPKALASAR
jgi:tetratricopeptide (TPR) repeat protein